LYIFRWIRFEVSNEAGPTSLPKIPTLSAAPTIKVEFTPQWDWKT
jgi:hypothetical protein